MLQVELEDTLSEFFAAEERRGGTSSSSRIFISYNPISEVDLDHRLPRNTKYLIQQWRTSNDGDFSLIINLILMPQRMSWIMGRMTVLFFKGREQLIYGTLEEDLQETNRVIAAPYRFEPSFCDSLEQFQSSSRDSIIIPYLPSDGLNPKAHLLDPDIHYEILSKRALSLSGLPTPRTQLIDFARPEIGWDREKLDMEVDRALKLITGRTLPFVLKTNSAGGSKGVYLVRTLTEKATIKVDISQVLHSELPSITQENGHLHPCSLLLTDLLPGKAAAVNFYVRGDGQAQFSSCCRQDFSDTGHWVGGAIKYSTQTQSAALYKEVMERTAAFLHSRGYKGPVGIDVMADKDGELKIVDLNPRPTGTFVLGCLRPHFVDQLGMDEACVLPYMEFFSKRTDFNLSFEKELSRGDILTLAWYSTPGMAHSFTCLAVGARDNASLEKICRRIEIWTQERQAR